MGKRPAKSDLWKEWLNGYCQGVAVMLEGNFSDAVMCGNLTLESMREAGVDERILDLFAREGVKEKRSQGEGGGGR